MSRLRLLTLVALVGAAIAVVAVIRSNRAPPTQTTAAAAVPPPFASYVAGTGITETGWGNVAIGTPVSGVVREVYVRAGDPVDAGNPLFKLDDRELQARLAVARAQVQAAAAAMAKPRHRLDYLLKLQGRDRAAVSDEMVTTARDDVDAAAAALAAARAAAAQIEVDLERLLVRAPAAGRILQVNTRVGEFAASEGAARPLMLLGDDRRMYLRVDIDETDAWRVRPQAAARAFVRGNPQLSIPLRFEYIEPYVTPKTALTGQPTERSDLRVLQVIYSFERAERPVYLGQQMDVFIEAAPGPAPTGHD